MIFLFHLYKLNKGNCYIFAISSTWKNISLYSHNVSELRKRVTSPYREIRVKISRVRSSRWLVSRRVDFQLGWTRTFARREREKNPTRLCPRLRSSPGGLHIRIMRRVTPRVAIAVAIRSRTSRRKGGWPCMAVRARRNFQQARARNEKGGQVRVDANYTRLPAVASVVARARNKYGRGATSPSPSREWNRQAKSWQTARLVRERRKSRV